MRPDTSQRWIQAASLNNIGTDYENSKIKTAKLTVGDIVNNGGISARIVGSTGTITNNATGLFVISYIDNAELGFLEAASLTAEKIINGGTFTVYSEAALPTPIDVTSFENSGTLELSGVGMTLTGDIVNNANAVIVTEAINTIKQYGSGGNLDAINPQPMVVKATPDADARLQELNEVFDSTYDYYEGIKETTAMTIWARAFEKVCKLSLLYAISRNPAQPIIDLECVEWAKMFVEFLTKQMLFLAST